ncbi:MAG: competence/damage-inducible protein A [Deltaproteobacteria bacterium]|nr:competence/damage-inducible protein A [Deltaproteobacteria bacterium]
MDGKQVHRPTAAILIIGNEILCGSCPETNSALLLRLLREAGVRTRRLVVLPDELEPIAEELRRAAEEHDHVFTSGGIGPTHDDRTLEAVARAFDLQLVEHPRLKELFAARFGPGLSEAQLKMVRLPAGCELLEGGRTFHPLLRCRNVFILPGIPQLFEDKLGQVRKLVTGRPPAHRCLVLHWPETRLAPYLDEVVAAHPEVEIGSYPILAGEASRVEVTFEAADDEEVEAAVASLCRALPPEAGAQRG